MRCANEGCLNWDSTRNCYCNQFFDIRECDEHEIYGSGTFTLPIKKECKHAGLYRYISFLCFRRKYLICEKCFEIIPQGKWGFFV